MATGVLGCTPCDLISCDGKSVVCSLCAMYYMYRHYKSHFSYHFPVASSRYEVADGMNVINSWGQLLRCRIHSTKHYNTLTHILRMFHLFSFSHKDQPRHTKGLHYHGVNLAQRKCGQDVPPLPQAITTT